MTGSAPDAGDVVWIDFGSPVGHEQSGRRPALVLTDGTYNSASSVLVVCPISRSPKEWPFKVPLPQIGRLTGFILVDQIKAIDPAIRALRKIGQVPAETLAEVRGRLAVLLGIPVATDIS